MKIKKHLDKIKQIQKESAEQFEKEGLLNKLTESDIINHFGLRGLLKIVYEARGEQYILDRLNVLKNEQAS